MKVTDNAQKLLEGHIAELGYELVEVQYKKEQGNMVLTFYIDAPSGITMDDCEKVSRLADPLLDEADLIQEPYYLSVSSLGLDRPLKTERDFKRGIGKKVTAKLYAAKDKKKEFTGTLIAYNDDELTLEDIKTGEQIRLERKDVASVKPYIEF